MSRNRTNILMGTAIASWLAIACTAGTAGAPAFNDDGYDRPPIGFDRPPSTGHDSVQSSTDRPTLTGDNPGTQGGGGCPPCDGKFKCTATIDGQQSTQTSKIELMTVNGECRVEDEDDISVIACGGQILSNGKSVGTWASSGDGFTATATGTVSVNGQPTGRTVTVMLSCKRDSGSSTTTPIPTGTSTSVPVPTTTGTSRPPTVVDAGIPPGEG